MVFIPWFYYLESNLYYHLIQASMIIQRWIDETGLPVVIAPEQLSEVRTAKRQLYPLLSDTAKKKCILIDKYWKPEQAKALLLKSRLLVAMAHHSTYMSIPEGVPTIHVYPRQQGRKVHMFKDIGLGDYLFEMWEAPLQKIIDCMLKIHSDWDKAFKSTSRAGKFLKKRGLESMQIIKDELG